MRGGDETVIGRLVTHEEQKQRWVPFQVVMLLLWFMYYYFMSVCEYYIASFQFEER